MSGPTPAAGPSFSVLIPAYNRPALLAAALDSVHAQTRPPAEVIVADDGSTDATPAVAEAHPVGAAVLRLKNGGPCRARNAAAAAATGDYLAFLDSDDLWPPHALATYAAALADHPGAALLFAREVPFADPDELTEPFAADGPVAVTAYADFFAASGRPRWFGGSSLVVRRDRFAAAGGFDESWANCEDLDLVMRLGTAAGFLMTESPVTLGYRRHAGSLVSDADRTLAGVRAMLDREAAGGYPGGSDRRAERRTLLTRFARPASLAALAAGRSRRGWGLYAATLPWHLRTARVKYLAGFPLRAAGRLLTRPAAA